MRASHDLSGVSASFDEANLVPCAGLLPAAVLAQRLGLAGLVDERVHLARHGANGGTKALSVIGSMLAGGDSIDDTALLRAGALPELFDQTRAPSTIGSWLRAFKWHNVRQFDAVSRELLARLWQAGAGPGDLTGPMTLDLDSTIVAVFGRGKQGAAFGYTKVRGYHPQLATHAETGQVLFSRLRGGSAGAARAAQSFPDRDDQPDKDPPKKQRHTARRVWPPRSRRMRRREDAGETVRAEHRRNRPSSGPQRGLTIDDPQLSGLRNRTQIALAGLGVANVVDFRPLHDVPGVAQPRQRRCGAGCARA